MKSVRRQEYLGKKRVITSTGVLLRRTSARMKDSEGRPQQPTASKPFASLAWFVPSSQQVFGGIRIDVSPHTGRTKSLRLCGRSKVVPACLNLPSFNLNSSAPMPFAQEFQTAHLLREDRGVKSAVMSAVGPGVGVVCAALFLLLSPRTFYPLH